LILDPKKKYKFNIPKEEEEVNRDAEKKEEEEGDISSESAKSNRDLEKKEEEEEGDISSESAKSNKDLEKRDEGDVSSERMPDWFKYWNTGFEKKMNGFEKKMDGFEKKMDGFEKKMDGLEKKMDGLETRIDNIEGYTGKLAEKNLRVEIEKSYGDVFANQNRFQNLFLMLKYYYPRQEIDFNKVQNNLNDELQNYITCFIDGITSKLRIVQNTNEDNNAYLQRILEIKEIKEKKNIRILIQILLDERKKLNSIDCELSIAIIWNKENNNPFRTEIDFDCSGRIIGNCLTIGEIKRKYTQKLIAKAKSQLTSRMNFLNCVNLYVTEYALHSMSGIIVTLNNNRKTVMEYLDGNRCFILEFF